MRLEVSPSGRATCRTCETRIERGALRIAETTTQHDHLVERYHHLTCVVDDQPNGAMVAMLAAPAELRSAAEHALSGQPAFLASVARAAAGKAAAAASSNDEFDDETEALIGQLAANPRDASLLSVLHDHLQERGLPRGELIALELAKAPETARLVELKRQLWPVVKDVRVTWGAGFLRTMAVQIRDQASAGTAVQALRHPSARLLEELSLQRWVGPLPPIPPSVRRLEFQWCEGASPSVETLPRLAHLQLNHVEDAALVRSQSLTSLGFGPDVLSVPLAKSVPRVHTLVFEAPQSVELLASAGLLKQARVLVLPLLWSDGVIDALAATNCTWEQIVVARFKPTDAQRKRLKQLAQRCAVTLTRAVPSWVTHTSRPEWGLGRVLTRTASTLEVEFDAGVRSFPANATVLEGVEVFERDDVTDGSS
ncbi:MAG: DUF3553 domain-containing protein [Archangium sp.]|nr:DUF3553 domain-containing protein [Archangium sp.]